MNQDQQVIIVSEREVYGRLQLYPACEHAKTFCHLLGQKVLTKENIDLIKRLGYTVQNVYGLKF